MEDTQSIIETLSLQPHPEGGFYREMYRSGLLVKDSMGLRSRSAYTSIYYLLTGDDFSSWHRIQSDETWYFHLGCDVLIYFFDKNNHFPCQMDFLCTKKLLFTWTKYTISLPAILAEKL